MESHLRGIYPCKDGYVDIWGQDRVPQVVEMMDMPELMEIPLFASPDAREQPEVIESLDQLVRDWFSHHTRQEIWDRAQRSRVLAGPLFSMDEAVEEPHFRGRGFWATSERSPIGAVEYPGRPILMGESPWQMRRMAPHLGQHNEEVYCGMLGYSSSEMAQLRQMRVV